MILQQHLIKASPKAQLCHCNNLKNETRNATMRLLFSAKSSQDLKPVVISKPQAALAARVCTAKH
jgi:hypothetical protein